MMGLPAALRQDLIWIDREGVTHELTLMDPDHRSNLIPFLRGNCRTLYWLDHGAAPCDECGGLGHDEIDYSCAACDGRGFVLPDPATAEDWLELTPLMQRLTLLEARRPLDDRRATHERNVAHERETGYQKVRLG
jgi:hypothetical protein